MVSPARVQRGESATARCASTGDQHAPSHPFSRRGVGQRFVLPAIRRLARRFSGERVATSAGSCLITASFLWCLARVSSTRPG
jgi:hypothetical protein